MKTSNIQIPDGRVFRIVIGQSCSVGIWKDETFSKEIRTIDCSQQAAEKAMKDALAIGGKIIAGWPMDR